MDENKELLQLLNKIEKANRLQSGIAIVQCVMLVMTALCCICVAVMICGILPQLNELVPQINEIVPQVNEIVTRTNEITPRLNELSLQLQTVLGNLEETTTQLASADLQGMVENVDSFVVTGQTSLEQTMEKLNALDFEALNRAIKDLAAVVEPLANFFKRFG